MCIFVFNNLYQVHHSITNDYCTCWQYPSITRIFVNGLPQWRPRTGIHLNTLMRTLGALMVCVRANSSAGLQMLSLCFLAAGVAVLINEMFRKKLQGGRKWWIVYIDLRSYLFIICDKIRLVAVGAIEWFVSAQTETILRLICGHSIDGGDCHGHGSNEEWIELHCNWVVLEEKSKDWIWVDSEYGGIYGGNLVRQYL